MLSIKPFIQQDHDLFQISNNLVRKLLIKLTAVPIVISWDIKFKLSTIAQFENDHLLFDQHLEFQLQPDYMN